MWNWSPHVQACPRGARREALEVLYRRVPESLRPQLIAEVIAEDAKGLVDLSGLWVASLGEPVPDEPGTGRIVGALLTQPLPGRAAAVWAPEVCPGWRRGAIAAALVRGSLADLEARGFRLAQAVLDESALATGGRDLIRGGLPRVTDLLTMERPTDPPVLLPRPPAASLHWQPFGPEIEPEFRALVRRTYTGSLDMPELEGARDLDDVLEGHRSAGRFVPNLWRLGRVPGEPEAAAVLLLAEKPDADDRDYEDELELALEQELDRAQDPHIPREPTSPEHSCDRNPPLREDDRSLRCDRGHEPGQTRRRAVRRDRVWEVVYLGLTPEARGRGLGRAAVSHAVELARTHAHLIELAVDVRNRPALKLYESTGFQIVDRRAVHIRALGAGGSPKPGAEEGAGS
jgi:ribosomal protein S18 acetylase RimI-like enzyme